jgi:molybdopterin-guanine dinucleotide biosynthesis protein
VIDLAQLHVIGICGFSRAGKTVLLVGLVCILAWRGLRTLVTKRDAHGLDVDRGRDRCTG